MAVTPTGIRSKCLAGIRVLIAASSTFQAWTGAANAAAALAFVHLYEADDRSATADSKPRAIVRLDSEFSHTRMGVGLHESKGSLSVSFQAGPGSGLTTLSDQYTDFCNKIGGVISDCQAIAGYGNAGDGESYLNVVEWSSDGMPPERCEAQHEGGSFYFQDNYIVRWVG